MIGTRSRQVVGQTMTPPGRGGMRRTALASTRPLVLTEGLAQETAWQFDTIYEQFRERIYRRIRHLVGDRELAEDLTQDTFLRAFKALPCMPADLQLSAWLYCIATNVSYDALRRSRLIAWQPLEELETEPRGGEHDDPQVAYGEAELIRQVFSGIPEGYRLALLLSTECGYSSEQIAHTLSLSPGGVNMYLARARRCLRQRYTTLQREHERDEDVLPARAGN